MLKFEVTNVEGSKPTITWRLHIDGWGNLVLQAHPDIKNQLHCSWCNVLRISTEGKLFLCECLDEALGLQLDSFGCIKARGESKHIDAKDK